MELELKHLSPYLPYGLKYICVVGDFKGEVGIIHAESITSFLGETDLKPILRPLSDLTKEIEHNGEKFVPMVELAKIANLDTSKYDTSSSRVAWGVRCDIENDDNDDKFEVLGFDSINGFGCHFRPSKDWTLVNNQFELWAKLYEWHFDVFDLIENGLAIDVNTLNS